jgi:hypothetical protein
MAGQEAGPWERWPRVSWTTTLESQGTLSENKHSEGIKRFHLLLKMEMKMLMMKLMMMWREPVCHKTE